MSVVRIHLVDENNEPYSKFVSRYRVWFNERIEKRDLNTQFALRNSSLPKITRMIGQCNN